MKIIADKTIQEATQMKNVQAELPLQKPQDADRVYRMEGNA